jgi:hypothetical protein
MQAIYSPLPSRDFCKPLAYYVSLHTFQDQNACLLLLAFKAWIIVLLGNCIVLIRHYLKSTYE